MILLSEVFSGKERENILTAPGGLVKEEPKPRQTSEMGMKLFAAFCVIVGWMMWRAHCCPREHERSR